MAQDLAATGKEIAMTGDEQELLPAPASNLSRDLTNSTDIQGIQASLDQSVSDNTQPVEQPQDAGTLHRAPSRRPGRGDQVLPRETRVEQLDAS